MALKKQLISKSGDTWEWAESPETIKALKVLHESSKYADSFKKPRKGK
jgi:hypothetical protein